jgi:hypothetical protein
VKTYLLAGIALAISGAVVAMPASADTFHYQCGPRDRIVLDDTANTITWNGHVFTDGHLGELGCKFDFVATDKAGATAELCVATKGVASLDITSPKRHFECQQDARERR